MLCMVTDTASSLCVTFMWPDAIKISKVSLAQKMIFEVFHYVPLASFVDAGLYDQALLHASTGRDILFTYSQSLKAEVSREALLALARSHYIIGSVLTEKMQYASFILSQI